MQDKKYENMSLKTKLKIAYFMTAEKLLRFVIIPYIRAYLLKLMGAKIGKNVRIYEIMLFNLKTGFSNLTIEDDVYIAPGCSIDLDGPVNIGKGTSLSPGVSIITHADPGSTHDSPLCADFPPFIAAVKIGNHCWIGCRSVILAGSTIGAMSVVGACSLVNGDLLSHSVYVGTPAKKIRDLNTTIQQ